MRLLRIVALCLIVCCAQISAQNTDCDVINSSCVQCAPTVPQRDINRPEICATAVQDRWIWRNITQCDLQLLYCRNPTRIFTCDNIADMAGMTPRATPRCRVCTTRRRTTRSTRNTTRRPTRRTTRSTRNTTRRVRTTTTPKPPGTP